MALNWAAAQNLEGPDGRQRRNAMAEDMGRTLEAYAGLTGLPLALPAVVAARDDGREAVVSMKGFRLAELATQMVAWDLAGEAGKHEDMAAWPHWARAVADIIGSGRAGILFRYGHPRRRAVRPAASSPRAPLGPFPDRFAVAHGAGRAGEEEVHRRDVRAYRAKELRTSVSYVVPHQFIEWRLALRSAHGPSRFLASSYAFARLPHRGSLRPNAYLRPEITVEHELFLISNCGLLLHELHVLEASLLSRAAEARESAGPRPRA